MRNPCCAWGRNPGSEVPGFDWLDRAQGDWVEEPGITERPVGGVKRFVVEMAKVDVVEGAPGHLPAIQISAGLGQAARVLEG